MDIKANNLLAVKHYFIEKLSAIYPEQEIISLFNITVEELFKIKPTHINSLSEKILTESELLKFITVVKQLKQNKPIQYIFNKAPFWGMGLFVNEHVLIPRPETEELIDLIIKTLKKDIAYQTNIQQNGFGLNFLDIGTGSGCIALAIKKELNNAYVTALDTSREALNVVIKNAEQQHLPIHPVCADITRDYSTDLNYHIIVSNPPYVTPNEKEQMHKNVLDYEPHLALFTPENNPLYFYDAIAHFAKKNLTTNGWLFFEINQNYAQEIVQLLTTLGFNEAIAIKDINNNYRMVKAKKTM